MARIYIVLQSALHMARAVFGGGDCVCRDGFDAVTRFLRRLVDVELSTIEERGGRRATRLGDLVDIELRDVGRPGNDIELVCRRPVEVVLGAIDEREDLEVPATENAN